ncbi:MAG: hypothetical protein U0939_01800 [Pirellulales bacterium]
MAYQFQCPHGHLLEGEPEQAGQPCNCPVCGVLFLIPPPLPEQTAAPEAASEPEPTPAVSFDPTGQSSQTLLHIPCPKGHELEVPRDMLDQFVECPQCGEQFHLRERNSVEYKKKRADELERKWERRGQLWLNWSIAIAVMVILGLISLIALRS